MNPSFEHQHAEQFEHLSFAGDAELESERGVRNFRSPGMRARPMQRAFVSTRVLPRGSRPYPRWPYSRLPYYGGGWPYAAVSIFAEPFAEPEPFPDTVAVGDDPPPENEAPPTLSGTLARLPGPQRPAYQALGAIAAAIADPRSRGPGLYLIEFSSDGRRRAYSGQSGNVRTRLLQHQLCARMLGFSLAGHQVYVAALPALNPAQRRALEQRIHGDMLARRSGVLTNVRRELEVDLLGAEWE